MIIKNIEISSFERGHRNYHISEDGKLYLIKTKLATDSELPYTLETELYIYGPTGEVEKSFSLSEIDKDISNFYAVQENEPGTIEFYTGLYLHKNQIIVTTEMNRVYAYENEKLTFKHAYAGENLNNRWDDIKVQNSNLAGHFFKEKGGRIYLLTQGQGSYKYNRRDRYIISLSENSFEGIKEQAPDSIYLADVWENEINGFWIPEMKFVGNKNKLNKRIDLYDPMIFQVIDLNQENCLVSIFTDSRSKSAYPDKYTPYYFIILNKYKKFSI